MIHFGFSTYIVPPSWLLSQTLTHMTHTFHHAITAKSFIKKIKLTSRQSRMHISYWQCPDLSINRPPAWFHLPLLNRKKLNISWFPSLAHIPSFHLPCFFFRFAPFPTNSLLNIHTHKAKFMKIKFLCASWLFASSAGWRCPSSHPERGIRDKRSSWTRHRRLCRPKPRSQESQDTALPCRKASVC